jgi:hypothetical protein
VEKYQELTVYNLDPNIYILDTNQKPGFLIKNLKSSWTLVRDLLRTCYFLELCYDCRRLRELGLFL